MKNAKIKRMVGIAFLMAMVIVLQFISSSIPPIGGFVSISLVLIPIVMGGAVFGIGAGTILGVLAGFLSACIYKLLRDKNAYIAMLCAAVVCPVVNTGVFLTCMFAFFKDVLAAWAGGSNVVSYVLTILILCNFVPELLINVVFSPAGQRILHAVEK